MRIFTRFILPTIFMGSIAFCVPSGHAQGQTSSISLTDRIEVPKDWAESWAYVPLLLDLSTHYVSASSKSQPLVVQGTALRGDASTTYRSLLQYLAAHPDTPLCSLRLTLTRTDAARPIWTEDVPMGKEHPTFRIPVNGLKPGQYKLTAAVLPPGKSQAVTPLPVLRRWGANGIITVFPPEALLNVVAALPEPIQATTTDAAHPCTRTVLMGNPNRERFGQDNREDAYARGVRCLAVFDAKLFVGCGDWNDNRGPIDVWSLSLSAAKKPDTATTSGWSKELTVDEEAVDRFRTVNGRLYIPGVDAHEPTLSKEAEHSLGNLYIREAGSAKWVKRRTLPRAVHVHDVCFWQGKFYAGTGVESEDGQTAPAGLFVSEDGGDKWTRRGERNAAEIYAFRYYALAPWSEHLVLLDPYLKRGAWQYDGKNVTPLQLSLAPGLSLSPIAEAHSVHPFSGGIIYTVEDTEGNTPLLFLPPSRTGGVAGARLVSLFAKRQVADVTTDGNECLVLIRSRDDGGDKGEIFVSRDLLSWTRLAIFHTPARPSALARYEGKLYIGLDSKSQSNPASGSIWRLEE